MPSNHLILCQPLLLLPSIFPSIRVFSNESALGIRWPKYWSFSFNRPANEHPGLISFRMDWLDLLAVQGTRKSLLQHHNLKASILRPSNVCLIKVADAGDVADVRSRSRFGASLAVGRLAHWQRRQRRAGNAKLPGARPSGCPRFSWWFPAASLQKALVRCCSLCASNTNGLFNATGFAREPLPWVR